MQQVDSIPLEILYDEEDTGFKDKFLVINTRDPQKFEQLYKEASIKMMKKCEQEIEESLEKVVRNSSGSIKKEFDEGY
jgi:DNA polymerase/3'-5' exonuclease PolX